MKKGWFGWLISSISNPPTPIYLSINKLNKYENIHNPLIVMDLFAYLNKYTIL